MCSSCWPSGLCQDSPKSPRVNSVLCSSRVLCKSRRWPSPDAGHMSTLSTRGRWSQSGPFSWSMLPCPRPCLIVAHSHPSHSGRGLRGRGYSSWFTPTNAAITATMSVLWAAADATGICPPAGLAIAAAAEENYPSIQASLRQDGSKLCLCLLSPCTGGPTAKSTTRPHPITASLQYHFLFALPQPWPNLEFHRALRNHHSISSQPHTSRLWASTLHPQSLLGPFLLCLVLHSERSRTSVSNCPAQPGSLHWLGWPSFLL